MNGGLSTLERKLKVLVPDSVLNVGTQICEPVSLANSSKSIQVAKRGTTLYRAVISSNAFVAP